MKNWALVALAAFLPRRPAPGLLGDDVEVDRRRPRTLVEDFIKDARPYESALPAGVEPAAEVLQHFPETSFERCPELEAFTEKIRAASTSPEMLSHLDKTEPGRNPDKYKVPERVADYYGRKWRGLESDALWAARELREKGVFALREVVPRDEVAALRKKAEDSWCAVASALHARNLSHCLFWKIRGWGEFKGARECRDEVKFARDCVEITPSTWVCSMAWRSLVDFHTGA